MKKLTFVFLALFFCLSVMPVFAEELERGNDGEIEVSFSEPVWTENVVGTTGDDDEPGKEETVVPAALTSGIVTYGEDGSTFITITATGDVTIGRNVKSSGKSIFQKELEKQNNDVNFIFRNVRGIFENDSLTIVNFEGVLAEKYSIPSRKQNNDFLFLAPVAYASVLPDNGVEMAAIENNHIGDFGEDGTQSTRDALDAVGVLWADSTHSAEYEIAGIRMIVFAYQTLNQPYTSDELAVMVREEIARVRDEYDLVIVYYHWGDELDYAPKDNQVKLGRATVDAGADLVLGSHSHRINPIECYQGKYIVYSLANCSFAGNNKPSDMYTFIFQNRFRFKNGRILQSSFRIIPCRISSRRDYNDFCITPLTEQTNIDTVINTMKQAGKKLTYAVESYPLDWE